MGNPYLITGLPRSRSAWLSAVANTEPGSICYHEPVKHFSLPHEAMRLWDTSDYHYVGISDSSFGFHLAQIIEDYDPQIVVVERALNDAIASATRLGYEHADSYCIALKNSIEPFLTHAKTICVSHNALNDPFVVQTCLRHLMPGSHPDYEKIREFQWYNVQVDMERLNAAVRAKSPEELADMLGPDVIERLNATLSAH